MSKVAKLFSNGGSQAVRLPAEFKFAGEVVYVRRDNRTGDVVLSSRPQGTWKDFMELRQALGPIPDDFLSDRDQQSGARDPFKGWKE